MRQMLALSQVYESALDRSLLCRLLASWSRKYPISETDLTSARRIYRQRYLNEKFLRLSDFSFEDPFLIASACAALMLW